MADGLASTGEAASGTYKALLDRARAALAAEADGPAVPEGREPASVVGEPSDEDLLAMWFREDGWEPGESLDAFKFARAVLARWGHHSPDATKMVGPGPSIEAVGSLIAWLSEQACQAADAGQPTDAGMLTWAAQVIGERVDEAAPAPMAARDVAELALKELERTVVLLMPVTGHKKIKRFDTIRAALKRLQELENKADLSPTPMPLPAGEVK
jgi:hypothetical protein